MLVCVAINYVELCSAGEEISLEEGDSRLSPSSIALLGLVLFGCLLCVFFGVLCEIVICFNAHCAMSIGFR
jgi:hypothetical protein